MSTTFNNNNLSSIANLQETNSESINDVRNTELSTREYSINAERNNTRVKRGLSSQDLNRIFRSIISVLFCLILILFVFFIIFKATNVPYRVMISNVTGNSATISWVTNRKDIGVVIYGDQKVGFTDTWGDNIEYDDRDWAIAEAEYANNLVNQGSESMSIEDYDPEIKITQLGAYYVHHVQIKNLNPQTQYYFRVGNGLWSWDVNPERQKSLDESFATANLFTFTTFDSPEQLSSPNPAYGRIYSMYRNDSGFLQENDSTDSIVYTKMVKADGSASSEILSSVTNDMGGWTIDKSNFRDNQGLLTESYEDGVDKLSVFIQYENYSKANISEFILGIGDAPTEHILGNTWDDIEDEDFTVQTKSKSKFEDLFLGNVFSRDAMEIEPEEESPETGATGNTNSVTGNSTTASTNNNAQCKIDDKCEVVSPECFGVNGLRQNYNNGCTYGYTNKDGCCVADKAEDECVSDITGAIGCDRPNCYCKILETGDWEPINKDCRPLSCRNNRPNEAVGDDGHIEFCKFGVIENGLQSKCNDNPVMAVVGVDNDDKEDETAYSIDDLYDDSGNLRAGEVDDKGSVCICESVDINDNKVIDENENFSTVGVTGFKNNQSVECKLLADNKCHWTRPEGVNEAESFLPGYPCTEDLYNQRETFTYDSGEIRCEKEVKGGETFYNFRLIEKVMIGDICTVGYSTLPEGIKCGCASGICTIKYKEVGDPCFASEDLEGLFECQCSEDNGCEIVEKQKGWTCDSEYDNQKNSEGVECMCNWAVVKCFMGMKVGDTCTGEDLLPCALKCAEGEGNDLTIQLSDNTSGENCYFPIGGASGASVPESMNKSTNLLTNKIYAQENEAGEENVNIDGEKRAALYMPESGLYTLDLGETQMDLVLRSNSNYYFYEEVNGVDGFQIPSDPYNPKEGEDRIYNLAQMEVKLEKKASTYEIELKKGINIISFPFMPTKDGTNAMKASEFLEYVNNQAQLDGYERGAGSITYFDGGKWDGGYKIGSTDNRTNSGLDFDLLFGRGYLVVADKDIKVDIPGFEVKSEVPIAFGPGWNLIGVHGYTDAYTASSFIDSITEIDGLTADNVTYWPTSKGAYQGLQKTGDAEYGFDFPIFNNVGYFVRISEFAPANDNTRTLIWNPGTNLHGKPGSNM
ncbi:MAG TPA: fibronectin type III domain-containing protein [Candidatus Dojkabacteria bacterium]|nr:fibronectin type III domain-containing protein [Candidatus Dojkabacteria bacterium]